MAARFTWFRNRMVDWNWIEAAETGAIIDAMRA